MATPSITRVKGMQDRVLTQTVLRALHLDTLVKPVSKPPPDNSNHNQHDHATRTILQILNNPRVPAQLFQGSMRLTLDLSLVSVHSATIRDDIVFQIIPAMMVKFGKDERESARVMIANTLAKMISSAKSLFSPSFAARILSTLLGHHDRTPTSRVYIQLIGIMSEIVRNFGLCPELVPFSSPLLSWAPCLVNSLKYTVPQLTQCVLYLLGLVLDRLQTSSSEIDEAGEILLRMVIEIWENNAIEILISIEDDRVADMVVRLYFVLDSIPKLIWNK